MGSYDRSKKRIHQWKKAAFHLSLCFIMGFFTGFAPASTASLFTSKPVAYKPTTNLGIPSEPVEIMHKTVNLQTKMPTTPTNPFPIQEDKKPESRLLTIVTTTRSGDQFQEALLTKLAHTLQLVQPPLLWIVVEAHSDAPMTAKLLRETGIMYRHLTFKENFSDKDAEDDHQRNVALNHIEHHRLNGTVHFAGLSNTYDLRFFEEIRHIEVFGTWPVAIVSMNKERVVVEGPICNSSKVVGWRSKDFTNGEATEENNATTTGAKPSTINISGFAFKSSILWDPERWGRPSSVPDISQDSIKFIQQVVLEDEAKLRPIDCSRIMMWHLDVPSSQGSTTPSKL